jgi:hypothetical protein
MNGMTRNVLTPQGRRLKDQQAGFDFGFLPQGVTTVTHRGFSHIGLSTLDLDKTRAFYQSAIG